jgi:aminopeptidase N
LEVSADDTILEHVKALVKHSKLRINNMNKVQVVMREFVADNLLQFHKTTMADYEILGDSVIKLNKNQPIHYSRIE